MKKLQIAINKKPSFIKKLENEYEIFFEPQKSSILHSIFQRKSFIPDLFFYYNLKPKTEKKYINTAKSIIVSSNGQKNDLLKKYPEIDQSKLFTLYTSLGHEIKYDPTIKLQVKIEYEIPKDHKIILFTSNDLLKSGISNLLRILKKLDSTNFVLFLESNQKQLDAVRFQLKGKKFPFKIIYKENYKKKEELYMAADFYLFPSEHKAFNVNIIRAMSLHTVVFVPSSNYTSEILEPFAVMNSIDDPATSFKIDALLSNDEELDRVQKLNFGKSLEFSQEKYLEKLKKIIS